MIFSKKKKKPENKNRKIKQIPLTSLYLWKLNHTVEFFIDEIIAKYIACVKICNWVNGMGKEKGNKGENN